MVAIQFSELYVTAIGAMVSHVQPSAIVSTWLRECDVTADNRKTKNKSTRSRGARAIAQSKCLELAVTSIACTCVY